MTNLSRMTDLVVGICCCHSKPKCRPTAGIIITSASLTNSQSFNNARVLDLVVTFCGHIGFVVSGFEQINIEERSTSHVGSVVAGCITGIVVTGASNVYF